jgi:predicted DCC family thiol-disulfide oxidoreductase YuxK
MLFDGVCVFCSGAARFILARDRVGRIGFSAMQSPAGQAMLRRLDMPLSGFETFAVLVNNRLYIKSDGLLRLAALMPWPWPLAGIFKLVPRRFRDWLYGVLARNRYRLSGRRAQCMVPAPEFRHRFLQTVDDLPSEWKPRKIN